MNKPETDLESRIAEPRRIVPARKVKARVAQVLRASGDDFVSQPVDRLDLTYAGVTGDFHAGLIRKSGSREPWYARGTDMRNERQISIVSTEELADVAANMALDRLEAGWIGANVVFEGVEALTWVPPRSLLMFDGGVTLRVDGANGPCRFAGGAIASHVDGGQTAVAPDFDWTRTDMALAFVEAARMKRGLVAWVEREGTIRPGESVTIRIWEQWIY